VADRASDQKFLRGFPYGPETIASEVRANRDFAHQRLEKVDIDGVKHW
jgi:hypothetical protein